MTIKYRVYTQKNAWKEIVADNLDEQEAREACAILQETHPLQKYDIEEYNWAPEAKRLGRDPDLH